MGHLKCAHAGARKSDVRGVLFTDSMECYTHLRNIQDLLSDGKTPRFGKPFKGPIFPFGSLVEYYPIFFERPVKNPSIWKESLTWIVPWVRSVRGWNLEG